MGEKLKAIFNHYGLKHQLKQLNSEVFELNEAILQHENKNPITAALENVSRVVSSIFVVEKPKVTSIEHIVEEMADVMVILEQFRLHYDISTEELRKVFEFKVDRQIERIEGKENVDEIK